jgi:hydroxymethylglutaryl-CoA synthase
VDFIRCNPSEKVIVIATDFAKYDLNSTGEYTQGAGAIAMLLSANPELIEIHPETGVSTEGVFDFFKPRRNFKEGTFSVETNVEANQIHESELLVYKEQPVFDGAYSQKCYVSRTKNAYLHLKKKLQTTEKLYENWDAIVMHLPYCFQARRSFIDIFAEENPVLLESQPGETLADKSKALYKSSAYATLVESKIATTETLSGLIGNIYTGSIFLALLGYLFSTKDQNIVNQSIGFIAYGSGSKSKAFIGTIGASYQEKIFKLPFDEFLSNTIPITFDTYVDLHTKNQKKSIVAPKKEWILHSIEQHKPNLVGARYYQWID